MLAAMAHAASNSQAWNWNSFASTLVATIAGAGVTAVVGWFIFRGQTTDRYQERVADAFTQFLSAVTMRIGSLEQFKQDVATARIVDHLRVDRDGNPLHPPSAWELTSNLQLAIMVARGFDATLMDVVRQRLGDTPHFDTGEEIDALGNISVGITQYRAGLWSLQKSVERIRKGRQIDRSSYAPDEQDLKPTPLRRPRSV